MHWGDGAWAEVSSRNAGIFSLVICKRNGKKGQGRLCESDPDLQPSGKQKSTIKHKTTWSFKFMIHPIIHQLVSGI